MSTPLQTERVKEILDLALERPTQEREAFVSGMCGGDAPLRDEVFSLLRSLVSVGTILDPQAPAEAPPAEPLTGLKFGAYRITERIGAGGMGVVYKADDTRLGRAVAVKALPPHLASDPHRRARFEHEARVLASLNHPNIEAIYGVEDTPRGPVMVLEFVPGESLARRLERGPLPLDEALTVARQVLRALEAAHAAGIIHRDLKPANIHILPDGVAKVLDFGIAKLEAVPLVGASPSTPDRSPLIVTAPMGVLGTAPYMSPEQARGKPVDRRTDPWAFGCVLYEMLTGRRLFEGETLSDTLAGVLRVEPDWSRLPAGTPPNVRRLLRRCLEKDPDRRLRDAGDARVDLDSPDSPPIQAPRRRLALAGAFAGGALIVALAAGALWPWVRPDAVRPADRHAPTLRFTLNLPADASVVPGSLAVAPDGSSIVYAAGREDRRRLMRRSLDSPDAVELPGTEGAMVPFFSPDGAWVGFVLQEGQLKRVPASGGGAEVIIPAGAALAGCAWAPDGSIIFQNTSMDGFRVLPAIGGVPRSLPTPEGDPPGWQRAHPEIIPDADAFLCTVFNPVADLFEGRIEAVRISTGDRSVVFDKACCARFVPGSSGSPDRILFWQAGSLLAAPFDTRRLRVTGKAARLAPLTPRIEASPNPRFAVSRTGGVLAVLPGAITFDSARLAWYDPAGPPSIVTRCSPGIDTPRLSPDGTRVAFINSAHGGGDLWVHVLGRGNVRLTSSRDTDHPVWTPDGRRIVFARARAICRIDPDAGSEAETLWQCGPGVWGYPSSISPDGRTILLTLQHNQAPKGMYAFDAQSRADPRPLFQDGRERLWPRLSPDAALLAYTAFESGTFEVFLHRYPDLSEQTLVSTGGGYRPTWSPDGKRLYYQHIDRIFAADIEGAAPLRVSPPRVVLGHAPDLRFDVASDGRILMPHPTGDWGAQDTIDVTIGWEALLGDAPRPRN